MNLATVESESESESEAAPRAARKIVACQACTTLVGTPKSTVTKLPLFQRAGCTVTWALKPPLCVFTTLNSAPLHAGSIGTRGGDGGGGGEMRLCSHVS
jgi:hypothetical protein